MASAKFIELNGKRIFYLDAVNSDMEEMVTILGKAKSMIIEEPKGSVLMLTTLGSNNFHGIFKKIAKDFTLHNAPYIRFSAIVGLTAAQQQEFAEVANYSHRDFKFFNDIPSAIQWLIQQ
jgi:hypothetical protein